MDFDWIAGRPAFQISLTKLRWLSAKNLITIDVFAFSASATPGDPVFKTTLILFDFLKFNYWRARENRETRKIVIRTKVIAAEIRQNWQNASMTKACR